MKALDGMKRLFGRRKRETATTHVTPTYSAPDDSQGGDLHADDRSSVLSAQEDEMQSNADSEDVGVSGRECASSGLSAKEDETQPDADLRDVRVLGKECVDAIAFAAGKDYWFKVNNPFTYDGLPGMMTSKEREEWLIDFECKCRNELCLIMVNHSLFEQGRLWSWDFEVDVKGVTRANTGTKDGERQYRIAVKKVDLYWLSGPDSRVFPDSYERLISLPGDWSSRPMDADSRTSPTWLADDYGDNVSLMRPDTFTAGAELSQWGISAIASATRSLVTSDDPGLTSEIGSIAPTSQSIENMGNLMLEISAYPM